MTIIKTALAAFRRAAEIMGPAWAWMLIGGAGLTALGLLLALALRLWRA